MGDEHAREALAREEAADLLVEALAGDLVEGAEGLVEEEQLGLDGERAGDGGAHAHAAGELGGAVLREVRQADPFDRVEGGGAALGLGDAGEFGGELDVAGDGAPGQERGLLEDVAEAAGADLDRAGGGGLEPGREAEHRGLAAAGGADEGDEFAGADLQVDVVERAGAVREGQGGPAEGEGRVDAHRDRPRRSYT
nr:hypothetical protein GCM10025732_01800 [Glycomyces mayteni]